MNGENQFPDGALAKSGMVYKIIIKETENMSGHILKLSENVTRNKVVYENRYGLDIVGELYHKKDLDLNKKHAALIVGAPYGGVKEQGPCVYGNGFFMVKYTSRAN
jgi:hypothetical protein